MEKSKSLHENNKGLIITLINSFRCSYTQPHKILNKPEQHLDSTIHLHVIPVMKCGCVLGIHIGKLATWKETVAQPACAHVVSRKERCEVLACFHVIVKMYQYSLVERVFIVKTYWTTGSIKNCQRRFVEQFGGRNPPSKRCIQLLVKKLENKRTLLDQHGGGRPEISENTVQDVVNR
jgi:hypothetical protein